VTTLLPLPCLAILLFIAVTGIPAAVIVGYAYWTAVMQIEPVDEGRGFGGDE